jgi:hypothetical protein
MPARTLSLLTLALLGLAHAAPAPLPRRGPAEQAPVKITGTLRSGRLTDAPHAIVTEAEWGEVAKAWGVKDAPHVDFRRHFLAVHVGGVNRTVRFENRAGDLVVVDVASEEAPERRPVFGYLIQSFPRSAVKTVNGLPLPKR